MAEKKASVLLSSNDAGIIPSALSDPTIPHLYMNAVGLAATNGDVCLLVMQNGITTATVNMSFTVAKGVGVAIGQAIAQLESATGQPIMTMDHIREKMETSGSAK